ncbi:hypothetical protein [Bacillus massiliglaciei]|uniref:hypothetical protein n=1 Tax=Bacillus massiliglaciei TaxID=1816693 RepID=UPI000DA62B75|nr:hypothetical protein [Bacillus massiliglaciei]
MDKPALKKGMTIKINGVQKKSEPINQPKQEPAGKEEESFEWILPDTAKQEYDPVLLPVPAPKKKKAGIGIFTLNGSRFQKLKKPVMAILCAIVLGTGAGLFAIKMVTKEQTKNVPAAVTVPAVNEGSQEEKPAGTAEGGLKAFLVQGGVFSSEAAAAEIQESVRALDLPAEVFKAEDSYYLFIGAAEDLEASKALAQVEKAKGADVYWKELDFKTGGSLNEAQQKEMAKLDTAFHQLAEISASGLRGEKAEADIETAKKAIDSVETKNLPKGADGMKKELTAAAELSSSDSEAELLEAQGNLLLYLKQYQTLGK